MRTKNPDPPTRNKLLDAAQEVMLSKGYVAASVDEICAAAGVTKGSFFHYFKNKEELGKVLLQRFTETQTAHFTAACGEVADPFDRVLCLIDCAIESIRNPEMKGCLVGTFAQEIWETHPELRQVCQCSFEGFASSVSRDLVEAKSLHAPDGDFDAAGLGSTFLAVIQGSMLIFKTDQNRESIERNLLHYKNYLQMLYGRS